MFRFDARLFTRILTFALCLQIAAPLGEPIAAAAGPHGSLAESAGPNCDESYSLAIRVFHGREARRASDWREFTAAPIFTQYGATAMIGAGSGASVGLLVGELTPVPHIMTPITVSLGALLGAGGGLIWGYSLHQENLEFRKDTLSGIRREARDAADRVQSLRNAKAMLREAREWNAGAPAGEFPSLKALSDAMSRSDRMVPVGRIALALREFDREGGACQGLGVRDERDLRAYVLARIGDVGAARVLSSTIHVAENPKGDVPRTDDEVRFGVSSSDAPLTRTAF